MSTERRPNQMDDDRSLTQGFDRRLHDSKLIIIEHYPDMNLTGIEVRAGVATFICRG